MKLAVPDLISNSYFPAAAAGELGFFKQEGLDVLLELIFPVDKCYAALRDGTIDFVGGGGSAVRHVRRGDGPQPAVEDTVARAAAGDGLLARAPEAAAAAVRAIVKTQRALKQDVARAARVGEKLFPPEQAALIAELIR